MNASDVRALLPLLTVSGASVVVMLAIAVRRNHRVTAMLTFLSLAGAFASLWAAAPLSPREVTRLLVVDAHALYYMGALLAASAAVVVLCYSYFEKQDVRREELYVLLLVAVTGAMVLVSSSHFASFFLGLELLSTPLFALIAYLPRQVLPLEAGIKYLILAAASVAFLLFGMALVYGELGTLEFARMAPMLSGTDGQLGPLVIPGLVLILTGIGFKLAVVPFHLWTPDVYEGAPAPVTAFVATVSKGAMIGLLMRYFYDSGAFAVWPVSLLFIIVAISSMIAGNVLALLQNNVKRILAYSSIAHLGYILAAFQSGGALAPSAVAFYVAAYFVTVLGAFSVITVLSTSEGEPMMVDDYRGLFWERPWLGGAMTAMLLSLAGVPLTAGFFAKYYVLAANASRSAWLLALVLVVTSAVGVFYYLRIIVAIYSGAHAGPEMPAVARPRVAVTSKVVLTVLAILLLWLGVYPRPLLAVIRTAVSSMQQ